MERTAKIIKVLPEQRFNGKNGEIVKNSFVIEWHDSGFNNNLCLEVLGSEKWEKMKKSVVVGNEVVVKYEATSREYKERWYTSCQCYFCGDIHDRNDNQSTKQQEQSVSQQPQDDPLPF